MGRNAFAVLQAHAVVFVIDHRLHSFRKRLEEIAVEEMAGALGRDNSLHLALRPVVGVEAVAPPAFDRKNIERIGDIAVVYAAVYGRRPRFLLGEIDVLAPVCRANRLDPLAKQAAVAPRREAAPVIPHARILLEIRLACNVVETGEA